MSQATQSDLVELLREVVVLLRRPDTDTAYSRYKNAHEAVAEMETHLHCIEVGDFSKLRDLEILFAPTGTLQDISINSGWGEYFLTLAERFDRYVASLKKTFS